MDLSFALANENQHKFDKGGHAMYNHAYNFEGILSIDTKMRNFFQLLENTI